MLDKNHLAEALDEKLQNLAALSDKWTPEILSFLLQLSDRPAEKSDVDNLKPRAPSLQQLQLTWAEILADDPMSDDELWRDVPFSPDSTGDEDDDLFSSVEDVESDEQHPRVDKDVIASSRLATIQPNEDLMASLRRVQFWSPPLEADADDEANLPNTKTVPELYAIRETLLMLQGLPTSLFVPDSTGLGIRFTETYVLAEVSQNLLSSLLLCQIVGLDSYHFLSYFSLATTPAFSCY